MSNELIFVLLKNSCFHVKRRRYQCLPKQTSVVRHCFYATDEEKELAWWKHCSKRCMGIGDGLDVWVGYGIL